MKGIQQRRGYYGSLDDTIITMEADESTPLLVDRLIDPHSNNDKKSSTVKKSTLNHTVSSWSLDSGNYSNESDYSAFSTKSFKSHFTELRVLAFALILITTLIIAIYLLVIEYRAPSITLSLDLVSHDVWSYKQMPESSHLQHENVFCIMLIQTGSRNCDTSDECLNILKKMENTNFNQSEELWYNFLIGEDGQAYEVLGWEYQSNMEGISQNHSLVIGVIGNYDENLPKMILLQTVNSLIKESSKRRKINTKYRIYGLRQNNRDQKEGQQLFNAIMKWPKFSGFFYKS